MGHAVGGARVNVLCLIGAVLAVTCIGLPWAIDIQYPDEWTRHYNLPNGPEAIGVIDEEHMLFITLVFVLGAYLSFLSPLAGVVQLIGIVGYCTEVSPHLGDSPTSGGCAWDHITFDIGFYLAIWAAALTFLSILFPFGSGYSEVYRPFSKKSLPSRDRYLTWNRI